MTSLYFLLYGAAVSWSASLPLRRLTHHRLSPRLGVAVWLAAIGSVLVAWTAALALVVATVPGSWADSRVIVLCFELLGAPELSATPGWRALLAASLAAVVVSAVVVFRAARSVLGVRSRSREHARTARLVGTPTDRPGVVVVPAARPAAYCVPGRPPTIVVTTAAMDTLEHLELAAVLAHENAHISGRHHHVLMVVRALAGSLPGMPLFSRGAVAVAELLEMSADDRAAIGAGLG